MTDMKQREATHQFVNKWHGRGKRMEMDALKKKSMRYARYR